MVAYARGEESDPDLFLRAEIQLIFPPKGDDTYVITGIFPTTPPPHQSSSAGQFLRADNPDGDGEDVGVDSASRWAVSIL